MFLLVCVFVSMCVCVCCRLSPAAYYAQRMIQYLSRRDSIRQRSLQNRLRTLSSSSDSQVPSPTASMETGDVDYEELE